MAASFKTTSGITFKMPRLAFAALLGMCACFIWSTPARGGFGDGPAPPYTVQMTRDHMETVRQHPHVTPTASADARFVVGQSRGWSGHHEYPFDVEAAHERLTTYGHKETIPAHDLFGYRITDADAEPPKTRVLVTTGNHNTEYTGSWAFQGFIDFVLSDDERARALRREAVFYVYPLVNPDGRYALASRGNPEIVSAGWLDHNRMWNTAGLFSTIDTLVPAIRYDTRSRVDYALDFHSASSTFLFSPATLFETPMVRAIAEHEPEIEPRAFETEGTTQNWARGPDGVNARFAYTPEQDNGLTAARSLEIGRSYGLALYDVLIGELANAPADDASDETGDEQAPTRDADGQGVPSDDELLVAAKAGDVAKVAELLEADHARDVTDDRGNNALHLAAAHGHDGVVLMLVAAEVALDARNRAGRTPLYLASEAGHEPVIEVLANATRDRLEADVDAATARFSWWHFVPLHEAAGAGETHRARLLLRLGAEIEVTDHIERTPLRYAAEGGHTDTAVMLIERGADVNARDSSGNTPLHLAAIGCRPRSEQWFSYCRGDCLKTDTLCEGAYPDLAALLIERGAEVTLANHHGWTPLHYAARYGHADLANLLVVHGADVNAVHLDGDTPLHLAASFGHAAVARTLIEYGAEVQAAGRWGRTPDQWARRLGHNEVVELLDAAAQAD